MFKKLFFLLFFFFTSQAYTQESIEDFFTSSPEQIVTLADSQDFLIGGIIHPLSGQPCLHLTDLVAKGAQNIKLKRIFIPFYIPLNENNGKIHPAKNSYGGWVYFPHSHLNVFKKGKIKKRKFIVSETIASIADPQGTVLAYQIDQNGYTSLKTKPWGICNGVDDHPSGLLDPRNTHISIESKDVTLRAPDGTKRYYHCSNYYQLEVNRDCYICLYCILLKEVLPNGKILRYYYNNERQIIKVESLDPTETHVYAAITLDAPIKGTQAKFSTNTGLQASYNHQTASYFKKDKHEQYIDLLYPLRLTHCNSPCFKNEIIKNAVYGNGDSSLTEYFGKHCIFKTGYKDFSQKNKKEKKPSLAFYLSLPSEASDFSLVYSMDYNQGTPGEQPSTTTVKHSDGLKTVYSFTRKMLPEKISEFDQQGKLAKEKIFSWTPNQWLASIVITNGKQVLYKKEFRYDPFGNPISEMITENLTGSDQTENDEITRVYSNDGRNLLLQEEHSNGKVICYTYLPETNLLTSQLVKEKGILTREFRHYDAYHNLIQVINDDGSSSQVDDLTDVTERKITHYVLRQQQPFLHMPECIEVKYLDNHAEKLFQKTHLAYDQWGNVIQEHVYDSEERYAYTIYKEYDEQGNLLSETNPLGQKATHTYDAYGRMKTSSNFSQTLHTSNDYDKRGRLIKTQEAPLNGTIRNYSFDYDEKSRLLKRTDNYNHSTTYTYDLIANLPTLINQPTIYHSDGTSLAVAEKATYDSLGRKTLAVDANGNQTIYTYNLYGSPTSILYADQSLETFRYAKNGLLESRTYPNGLTVDYQHDVLGNILSKSFSFKGEFLGKETFEYKGHKLLKSWDLEGNATEYTYDGFGRKISEQKGKCLTTYQYDSLGNLSITCEENGENSLYTHFKRDFLGRILEKSHRDSSDNLLRKIAYSYDGNGNIQTIKRIINGREAIETFIHDAYNRQISYEDAQGHLTTIYYDESAFHLQQQILKKYTQDPLKVLTVETYDPYGRLVKHEKFNAASQLISAKDIDYDPSGSPILNQDHVYQGSDYLTTQAIQWTYDPCHRVKKMTRALDTPDARTTEWTYHPGGNTATKTLPDNITLSYTYDPLNNLKSISSSDNQLSHTFTYNRLGHLLSASDELNNLTIKREVDEHGNILSEEFPNGIQIKKTYDLLHRPLSLSLPDGGEVIYSYDPLFLREVKRLSPTGKVLYEHTYDSYDESGYLLTEHLADHSTLNYETDTKGLLTQISGRYSEECQYDSIGNLISQTINGTKKEFAYDALSQLTSEPDNTYCFDSMYNKVQENENSYQFNALNEQLPTHQPIAYDQRGNLTSKSSHTYHYDPLNCLIEAEVDSKKIVYGYDPLGRKISKATADNREFYLHDGKEEIGVLSDKGEIKQLKILGRKAVALELQGNAYAPLIDTQGNIRSLIDLASKTQAAAYDYTAFGKQNLLSNKVFNPWQYASKRYDPDLGLIDFGKRHYDPQLGRWLSTDPAGFIDSHNLYQFNFNNPYRYFDPDGRFAIPFVFPLFWGFFGTTAAGATVVAIEITTAEVVVAALVTATVVYGMDRAGKHLEETINSPPTTSKKNPDDEEEKPPKRRFGRYQEEENKKQKVVDTYAPDRPLPTDKHGHVPDVNDASHTQLAKRKGGKGDYPQAREWKYEDGKMKKVRDIDFTDHGHPDKHRPPHQHRWEENTTGGSYKRQDAENLPDWTYQ